MYALIFLMLLIALAGMVFLAHLGGIDARENRHATLNVVRLTAQQGAQVFNACERAPVGEYSVADLVSGGYLPNGYATETPLGPFWGCQVSSGGANGGDVILLLLSGPYTHLAGRGSLAAGSNGGNLQTSISWDVAEYMGPQVAAVDNVTVGVLPKGSTTMTSIINHQQYDLRGLVNAPAYATPVIAQNLVAAAS